LHVIKTKSGAGGNRTRVQTRKQYAFYMFIPRLNFRIKAGSGPPTFTLAS